MIELKSYDKYIIAFSGGKDSMACFLHLLDSGIDKDKIELWHHAIDGKEGSTLMDWACTPGFCKKFAEAFGVKYYESWKVGGFEGEMLRQESLTAPTRFETPDDNIIECGGKRGKLGTRRKFPQVTADLRTRWCSAYLKIDVCTKAINNQDRFNYKRTLVITGERAEESGARANYKEFEPDRSDNRNGKKERLVDHWRPVHKWLEKDVWNIIESYKVLVHPAYRLGWGRLSCIACIFGSPNQWASVKKVSPSQFEKIASYEKEFGFTIHRKKTVSEREGAGTSYKAITPELIEAGMSRDYTAPIFINDWKLPAGAYGESNGPS